MTEHLRAMACHVCGASAEASEDRARLDEDRAVVFERVAGSVAARESFERIERLARRGAAADVARPSAAPDSGRIAEIEARLARVDATGWRIEDGQLIDGDGGPVLSCCNVGDDELAMLANAPRDVRYLLARLESAERALAEGVRATVKGGRPRRRESRS